ncbi:ADP-ribosylglycohydrolase family protein, partial [Elusimicrobiota bacterium]
MTLQDRFVGSLLGLALADASGAKYEGGLLGMILWETIGAGARGALRWTDDTQMSLVLAESLAGHGGLDADSLARSWADAMD